MKTKIILAVVSFIMMSCSNNVLVPMQKGWADLIKPKDSIQYYIDPNRDLVFHPAGYTPGNLQVKKGVIVSTGSDLEKLSVDAGTKGKYYGNDARKISVQVQIDDPRKIPFIPVSPADPNSFYMMDLVWEVKAVDEITQQWNPYCNCYQQYRTGVQVQKSVLSDKIVLDSAGTPKVHTVEITIPTNTKTSVYDGKSLEYVYLYVRYKDIKGIIKNKKASGVTYDGKDARYKKK